MATTTADIRQKFLAKLPNAWFRNGKQPGGNAYNLAALVSGPLAGFVQNVEALEIAIRIGSASDIDLDRQGIDLGVPRAETVVNIPIPGSPGETTIQTVTESLPVDRRISSTRSNTKIRHRSVANTPATPPSNWRAI